MNWQHNKANAMKAFSFDQDLALDVLLEELRVAVGDDGRLSEVLTRAVQNYTEAAEAQISDMTVRGDPTGEAWASSIVQGIKLTALHNSLPKPG